MTPRLTGWLIILLPAFSSCTKDFKGMNEDKKLITDKMLEQDANEGGYTLPGMQLGIVDVLSTANIEMQQNLNADNFGGYMSLPANYYANKNNGTYTMVDSWNNAIWNVPSPKVLNQWLMMYKKGFETKYPDLYSLAIIFKTFAGHRLVDIFGPIPYTQYGSSSDVKFDSEQEAYNTFFTELTKAVDVLKAAEAANPTADLVRYAKFDKSRFGGNYATWIKVANTLRLRLAIRISKVDPAKAQTEAEAAVHDSGGLLTDKEGNFEMTTGTVHPLLTITRDWNETRLNAAVESVLGGYHDPRLAKYALPATDPSLGGAFKGIRSGSAMNDKSYLGYSMVNFVDNPFVKLMDASESYFLRAEGAVRGWDMGGTAQDFYNQGITASFNILKLSGAADYLNDAASTPQAYVDPNNTANNAPPISTITIKWDESAGTEEKLERILTQKWIALFPDGQEAWSEFRRTGYPRLYPVVDNESNGDIPAGQFIRRITYPTAITNASQAAVKTAVDAYLGGQDKISTPIWWDVE